MSEPLPLPHRLHWHHQSACQAQGTICSLQCLQLPFNFTYTYKNLWFLTISRQYRHTAISTSHWYEILEQNTNDKSTTRTFQPEGPCQLCTRWQTSCTQLTMIFGPKRPAVDLSFSCVLLKNLVSVESSTQLWASTASISTSYEWLWPIWSYITCTQQAPEQTLHLTCVFWWPV